MSSNTLPVCPKTGSTSPSLTGLHTAPLREIGNAPDFKGRLREIGFFRDLSDAFVTQTITPRYTITADGARP